MNSPARVPAPKDLGEATIRLVVEFLPDAVEADGAGQRLLTPEALRLAYAIKGLRSQHAGEVTIRKVLEPAQPELPKVAEPAPRRDFDRLSDALSGLDDEHQKFLNAVGDLSSSLDRLGTQMKKASSRPDRYDAFLGSMAALGALAARRRPWPPGDPA